VRTDGGLGLIEMSSSSSASQLMAFRNKSPFAEPTTFVKISLLTKSESPQTNKRVPLSLSSTVTQRFSGPTIVGQL